MMISNIAYCGLKCDECPAYLAKLDNDDELRMKMVGEWGTPDYPLDKNDINCDGCKAPDGTHFKYCESCVIRKCASERKVETCAHCDEYGCNTLQEWLKKAGDKVRQNLDDLRSTLV